MDLHHPNTLLTQTLDALLLLLLLLLLLSLVAGSEAAGRMGLAAGWHGLHHGLLLGHGGRWPRGTALLA